MTDTGIWELGRAETQTDTPADGDLVIIVSPTAGEAPTLRSFTRLRDDLVQRWTAGDDPALSAGAYTAGDVVVWDYRLWQALRDVAASSAPPDRSTDWRVLGAPRPWTVTQAWAANELTVYGGALYEARQAVAANSAAPNLAPAHWRKIAGPTADKVTVWAAGRAVEINEIRLHEGELWLCEEAHTAAADNAPGTGSQWHIFGEPSQWTYGRFYRQGRIVRAGNTLYRSRRSQIATDENHPGVDASSWYVLGAAAASVHWANVLEKPTIPTMAAQLDATIAVPHSEDHDLESWIEWLRNSDLDEWQLGRSYRTGDVTLSGIEMYRTFSDHTATADNGPHAGAGSVWVKLVAPTAWGDVSGRPSFNLQYRKVRTPGSPNKLALAIDGAVGDDVPLADGDYPGVVNPDGGVWYNGSRYEPGYLLRVDHTSGTGQGVSALYVCSAGHVATLNNRPPDSLGDNDQWKLIHRTWRPDWNSHNPNDPNHILNKPTVPAAVTVIDHTILNIDTPTLTASKVRDNQWHDLEIPVSEWTAFRTLVAFAFPFVVSGTPLNWTPWPGAPTHTVAASAITGTDTVVETDDGPLTVRTFSGLDLPMTGQYPSNAGDVKYLALWEHQGITTLQGSDVREELIVFARTPAGNLCVGIPTLPSVGPVASRHTASRFLVYHQTV